MSITPLSQANLKKFPLNIVSVRDPTRQLKRLATTGGRAKRGNEESSSRGIARAGGITSRNQGVSDAVKMGGSCTSMRVVDVASPDDADQFERLPSHPAPVHHKLVPGSGIRVRPHVRRGSVVPETGSDRSVLSGNSTEADTATFNEMEKGEEGQPTGFDEKFLTGQPALPQEI